MYPFIVAVGVPVSFFSFFCFVSFLIGGWLGLDKLKDEREGDIEITKVD